MSSRNEMICQFYTCRYRRLRAQSIGNLGIPRDAASLFSRSTVIVTIAFVTHVTHFADNKRNIPLDFRQSTGRRRKRGKDNSTGWRFERIVIERWRGQERDGYRIKSEREGSSLLWTAAVLLLLLTAGASVVREKDREISMQSAFARVLLFESRWETACNKMVDASVNDWLKRKSLKDVSFYQIEKWM